MVKKISLIILSAAILVTGYFAFRNLNYWERSYRIFNSQSEQPFRKEFRRGPEGFEGREGGERSGRPERRIEGFERRDRAMPDSLRQGFNPGDRENRERMSPQGGIKRGGRHGGGDFQDGQNIRLGTVGWFLAVFASFTVISIYLDKAYNLIRKKKLKKSSDILP
jgi:hypothetical protein